jgi:cell division transport system ATP-binding protein
MRILIAVAKEAKSSVLMATHDMSMVEKFPGRIIRVENGGLKEIDHCATTDKFRQSKLLYTIMEMIIL